MSKSLIIRYSDLSEDLPLALCLDKADVKKSPVVAWKVLKCRRNQIGSLDVTYPGGFAFGERPPGNTTAQWMTSKQLESDQAVDLVQDLEKNFHWTLPYAGEAGELTVRNASDTQVALSLGSVGGSTDAPYSPAFVWDSFGPSLALDVPFPSKLYVYKNDDDVDASAAFHTKAKPLAIIDLASLPSTSDWQIKETSPGDFTFTQDGVAPPDPTIPQVHVTYELKLNWNDEVSFDEAQNILNAIMVTAKKKGFDARNDRNELGWLQVSKDGETAHSITTGFAAVVKEWADGNWSKDQQIWYSPFGTAGGSKAIERIAFESIAYYFGK